MLLVSVSQDTLSDKIMHGHLQGAAKKWTPKVFRSFLSNHLGS